MEEYYFVNLKTKTIGRKVVCHKKVTSTNDLAWLEVTRGAEEGTVIIADEQICGRGRFGRAWSSPNQKGIWLSVILYPSLFPEETFLLMALGAIAVTDLLKNKFNLPSLIRWPNDVIIGNRKVAGIIVESKYVNQCPNASVLGVGMNINISESEMPSELKNITTSLLIENNSAVPFKLEVIIVDLIYLLDKWYQKIVNKELNAIQDTWREFSAVLNKNVSIQVKGQSLEGKVTDLDPCKGIELKDRSGNAQWWRGEMVDMLRVQQIG
ncbi:MAG: biotin--[acetyl-CoA-carboxylase] ligase [Planctomycetota bacterium]|nr:biotin--[acetyl-CoA-carboxylase] ligase [Planctomycetota bacterium]MDI6787090.1 biotin--[acetyl-CoA-carboxylase] ligase [Planctomycetota bacterium]